jgi:hypothetical protein
MQRPIVLGLGIGVAALAALAWRSPSTPVTPVAASVRPAAPAARPAAPLPVLAPVARAPRPYDPQLLEAINTDFGSDGERTQALRALLERSGKATTQLVDAATRFQLSIGARSRISEWKCYQAGCLFRAESTDSEVVVNAVLEARQEAESADLNSLTTVVSDGHEHQLIVVLTQGAA